MQRLDEQILPLIINPEYQHFLLSRKISHGIHDSLRVANEYCHRVFELQETVRQAWNEVILWKPHCCGKEHELADSEIGILDCQNQENHLCGHPELTKMFHTVCVAAWIASSSNKREIEHPLVVLSGLKIIDADAQKEYGTSDDSESPTNPLLLPAIRQEIKKREAELYKTTIHPYMLQIAAILQ